MARLGPETCEWCGDPIPMERRKRENKTCSQEHALKLRRYKAAWAFGGLRGAPEKFVPPVVLRRRKEGK